jgi:GAF domain-containing protein
VRTRGAGDRAGIHLTFNAKQWRHPRMQDDSAGRDPHPNEQDFADLRPTLTELSRLTLAPGSEGLRTMLRRVASIAVRAIPGADGAGVTLLEAGRADTIVASADFVSAVDAIQYGLGQGPCITAAADRRTVHSDALESELDWPEFGPRTAALGVHSVLSLPLIADDSVVGAMNVYAHDRNAFSARARRLGELFSVPAAFSAHNAQALFQARRLAEELQSATLSRSVIDQALGVVMSRTGGSEKEAFDGLVLRSQNSHIKLSVLAQQLVDEAVRRAQARRQGKPDGR